MKIDKILLFITKVKVENNVKLFEAVDRCTIKVKKLKLFILTEAYTLFFNSKEQLMLIFCTFLLFEKEKKVFFHF